MTNRIRTLRKRVKKPKYPKISGNTIRNEFEFRTYKFLRHLLSGMKKYKLEYETEKINYVIESDYTPDFIITRPDGSKIYIECKGNGRSFDSHTQRKMIAVKAQNPDLDIRIVFYSDGKIGPKRKDGSFRRQSDWATKHGFTFTVSKDGEVPKDWLV